jgi:hypothetical protein
MDRNQVATSPGMGWRLKSESGGGMNQNRVAICVGIRTHPKVCRTGVNLVSFLMQVLKYLISFVVVFCVDIILIIL